MTKLTEQEKFWKGSFMEKYMIRNSVFDEFKSMEAWTKMLKKTSDVKTILECGANIGRDLIYLSRIFPKAKMSLIEINTRVFNVANQRLKTEYAFNGSIANSSLPKNHFDLVFTSGVLIHVAPENLIENCRKMFNYSKKYILIAEYFNKTPVSIDYYGRKNILFKRDFGRFFVENFQVDLIDYGFLWGNEYEKAGFDDITFWLFKK